MTRLYSTQRPVSPGTYPKPFNNKILDIRNFDSRTWIPAIQKEAWGYIDYDQPVSKELADAYELVQE